MRLNDAISMSHAEHPHPRHSMECGCCGVQQEGLEGNGSSPDNENDKAIRHNERPRIENFLGWRGPAT